MALVGQEKLLPEQTIYHSIIKFNLMAFIVTLFEWENTVSSWGLLENDVTCFETDLFVTFSAVPLRFLMKQLKMDWEKFSYFNAIQDMAPCYIIGRLTHLNIHAIDSRGIYKQNGFKMPIHCTALHSLLSLN